MTSGTDGKLRVLHVITRLIVGGAQENTLYTVIGQQQNPEWSVTLLAGVDGGNEGELHDQARAAGVDLVTERFLRRPIAPILDVIATWRLYRFMKQGKYDIVHTHSSKAGILGRVAARMAGVPVVVHTLHSLVFHEYQSRWKNRCYIQLKRWCAGLTDEFISVNAATAEGAMAAGIGQAARHHVVHSGMDLQPFLLIAEECSASEARTSLGIPAHAHVVGKVARLVPLKGHVEFLKMARIIADADPNVWFLLVGDGALRRQLMATAADYGILEHTVFAGLVEPADVPRHIQAMDVLVHSSLREGIARVLPQAGAVGKPVVTLDLDGASEVIEDGRNGYLVKPGQVEQMAQHVLELLKDPARCAAFGQYGRDTAVAKFDAALMVRKINEIYGRATIRKGGIPYLPVSRQLEVNTP